MKIHHVHRLEDSTVLRNFILSQFIYRFYAVAIKIPGDYCFVFIETNKPILKFIRKFKRYIISKETLKQKQG